jgi:hypothetical protein
MSPPSTIMGGITWRMGGLTFAMGSPGCLQISIQALGLSLMLVVLLISMGGLLFTHGSSLYLPTRQCADCFWVCPVCHGIDGIFSWWYCCAAEFFVSCGHFFFVGLRSDDVFCSGSGVWGPLWYGPSPCYQHLPAIPTPTIPPGVPVTHEGLLRVVLAASGGFPPIPPTPGMVPTVPGGLPPILPTLPAALPAAPPVVIPVTPPVAVLAAPPAVVPVASPVPHFAPLRICAELLKLNPIKDAKAFLDSLE